MDEVRDSAAANKCGDFVLPQRRADWNGSLRCASNHDVVSHLEINNRTVAAPVPSKCDAFLHAEAVG